MYSDKNIYLTNNAYLPNWGDVIYFDVYNVDVWLKLYYLIIIGLETISL